jgi:glycosyltransferase involved in cell wall biosynthesis
MARPRILITFPGRIGTAGIGTTAWHQAAGLARRGAEVHVACGSVERELPGVNVVVETMRVAGRKVPYGAVGRDRAMAYHDWRVARLLMRNRRGFDVVHGWPGGVMRTFAAAHARGTPAFLERPNAHTAYAFEVVAAECARLGMTLAASSPHAFNAVKLAREEREFAAADALLCPSDFVAATHAARGEPDNRLLRHRYGYDPLQFSSVPRSKASQLTITFLGRLEPRKGVHLALEAWRLAGIGHQARLILCGRTESGYDTILARLLEQPGVEQRGHVPDPAGLLRETDALILPSLEEGSALVTYEARGCGAMLLVSDRSGACARHAHDALVHPAGDVATLAQHLRDLAERPALVSALRANSLAGAADLTWDAAADALLSAYAQGIRMAAASGPRALAPVSILAHQPRCAPGPLAGGSLSSSVATPE